MRRWGLQVFCIYVELLQMCHDHELHEEKWVLIEYYRDYIEQLMERENYFAALLATQAIEYELVNIKKRIEERAAHALHLAGSPEIFRAS